ncbi:Serine arginine-rich splicing factor 2 [Dionaea muscipula]
MFSKFGVVKDVFIPKKRSKSGKRFGFVRYDSRIAADAAIQKTNGLWIHNKELKVKMAEYSRDMERRKMGNGRSLEFPAVNGEGIPMQRRGHPPMKIRWIPKLIHNAPDVNVIRMGGTLNSAGVNTRISYTQQLHVTNADKEPAKYQHALKVSCNPNLCGPHAHTANKGDVVQESMPVVKGAPIGNGWLYRSAIATFDNHQNSVSLLNSFIRQERRDVIVRMLGLKRILITFPSQGRMNEFLDLQKRQGSYWFTSVEPAAQ